MPETEQTIQQFGGIKDDEDPKQLPSNFFSKTVNFRFPKTGLLGYDMILMPSPIKKIGTGSVDGIFEYKYLDTNNVLQTDNITVVDGDIWHNCLSVTPVKIKSGLTTGRVSFVTFQDKLFIANGKNYINILYGSLGLVSEMGAPVAVLQTAVGNINTGTHYYAMTYVTAGGEEVIGSISNTITASAGHAQTVLNIPIGYAGTISRCIYRTEAGGTTLKLLYAVPDNTTLTYTDNIADGSLTTSIPATNNELPKPYFMTVAEQKLYAGKVDKYPTQIYETDTNLEVIDFAAFVDVANYGDDNTPISALGFDYNQVIVGTGRNIIFINPKTGDIVRTRGYVGVKDGYSMQLLPSFGDFPGGMFFISSLNDVRLIQGTQAAAVFQTIDNIRTDNWAQNIRGSLYADLASYSNISSAFYDNRYILVIDNIKYVFDIRTKGWTTENIKTTSYQSTPRCFAVMGGLLYNGQSDGWIEQEYVGTQYKGQDVEATLTSAYLNVSRLFKWFKKLVFWFKTSLTSSTNVSVVLDSNDNYPIQATVSMHGGVFNPLYFNPTYFLSSGKGDSDYRVVNITNPCRWAEFTLTCTSGNISFLQWGMVGQPLKNSEILE